jgi:HAD superfamily hydrolase (TIGR01509 family)
VTSNKPGVFFDLYGTLLIYGDMRRAWADWLEAFHSKLQLLGLSLPLEAFSAECEGFMEKRQIPNKNESFTPFELRIYSLCHRLGLEVSARHVSDIADHIAGVWERHVSLDSQALDALTDLSRAKTLALVSNFDHPRHIRRVMAGHGLVHFFQTTVISGEVLSWKPDPEIFNVALGRTGLAPHEVVYVGDTPEDVEGARAAGITPILIQRPGNETDLGALDYPSDSLLSCSQRQAVDSDVVKVRSLQELLCMLS